MFMREYIEIVGRYAERLPSGEAIEPNVPLVTYGIHSLAVIRLLADLEEKFGVTFPDECLTPDKLGTAGAIWRVLVDLKGEMEEQ